MLLIGVVGGDISFEGGETVGDLRSGEGNAEEVSGRWTGCGRHDQGR